MLERRHIMNSLRKTLFACMVLIMALSAWNAGEVILGIQKEASASSMKGGLPAERAARIAQDLEQRAKIDITYAALKAAADAGSLVPEQMYRIIDYRTVHQSGDETGVYFRGPIEPLIVRANTTRTLYPHATSEIFPYDIITYAIENYGDLYGSETGQIHYREDPDLDIWAHQDWRNWMSRWWESVEGSGVFDSPKPGYAYQDFPMFNPVHLVRGGYGHIHIGDQNWLDSYGKFSTTLVFMGRASKVTMGGGSDEWIFLNPDANIVNISIGDSSSGVVYGAMSNVSIGQNNKFNKFYGNVDDVTICNGVMYNTFMKNLTASMIGSGVTHNRFDGNVYGCLIMPGVSYQVHTSDKVGEIMMMTPPGP